MSFWFVQCLYNCVIFSQIERPFTNNPVIPLLDCVYDHVITRYPKRAFCILRNCVRVSDLLRSTQVGQAISKWKDNCLTPRRPCLSWSAPLVPRLAQPALATPREVASSRKAKARESLSGRLQRAPARSPAARRSPPAAPPLGPLVQATSPPGPTTS